MSDDLLDKLYRSVLLVEDDFADKFYVEKMADISCLSLYHFSRVFYSVTGMSPALYRRRRVLTKASEYILSTERGVLDIAIESGYESQEAFTRSFKKMFHVNPAECRKLKPDLKPYLQSGLTLKSLAHVKKGVNLTPDYRQHDSCNIVGVAKEIDFDGVWQANDIWHDYFQQTVEGKTRNQYYGVVNGVMVNEKLSSHINYLAGHKSASKGHVLPDMMVIQGGNYAVFTHEGKLSNINITLQYIWQIWIPKNIDILRGDADFEIYDDRFNQDTLTGVIEIWIPIMS